MVAHTIVSNLSAAKDMATIVTLSGDLGAGKTALVQHIAREFGIDEAVTSPTFILEKVYTLETPIRGFKRIVHIDAYRLESDEELKHLGWSEISTETSNLIFLEWPERVAGMLPPVRTVHIAVSGDTRTIRYEE